MRTTLTLDDDVAAKLKLVARRSGRAFRVVVNEALRRGLATAPRSQARGSFAVQIRPLGQRRPGLAMDNIAELLDQVEGSLHR